MQLQVLLFAAARDAARGETVQIDIAEDARIGDVRLTLARELPQLADLLPSCRFAVDCCYVNDDHSLSADCELALIPPVSGG